LKIDNKQKEDERWEKLVNELQEQNNKLQEQNTMLHERLEKKDARIIELEDRSTTLQEKLDQTRTRCSVGELLRCVKVSCPDREPKLGTRQLDVEQMMEDTYGS
jgi:septal ring factor EnvC (AmiA/AmiB activator)